MKFLRNLLDKQEKHFEAGGKLEKLYPLYEAIDTFLYTSGSVTKHASHTRDALDLKRMMMMVVYALLPTVIMALYNTGLQANLIIAGQSSIPDTNWQQSVLAWLGVGFDPNNIFENFVILEV